ncbi:MAG: LysR family transcriptional regulator [Burkholderiales bacterium]|nr:LysR family transcriptional regulator [Burkholderiales bacterium]
MQSLRGVLGFVKTVAAGSFAGAARELGVTPVAVSKNVQRLERELGVRLLQRSTRRLGLTEEGRLFHERCAGPLQALASAHAQVKDSAGAPTGVVRVTSVSPFGRQYVAPLLPQFSSRYPRIRIELDIDDALSDMIAERYDVGIRVGMLRDGSMVAREIAPLPFVVCGAPAYLAARGTPRVPDDLAGHNCLCLSSRGSGRALPWVLGAARTPMAVHGNFACNDLTTLVTAALHGQGLACAPLPLVLPLLRAGALVPLLPDWLGHGHHVFVHYPSRRGLPARVRHFVNFLVDALRANRDLSTDARVLLDALPGASVAPAAPPEVSVGRRGR